MAGGKKDARLSELPPAQALADELAFLPDSSPESLQAHKVLEYLDWLKYILLALVLGLFLTDFVFQRNEVVGSSMYPTLVSGDQLWVEKIGPRLHGPDQGDIITFSIHEDAGSQTDEDLVKRVIGLPGQHVEIKGGQVYIDDELLAEPYLPQGTVTEATSLMPYTDVTLGTDEYYVLGDNRSGSRDSRYFGPIKREQLIGYVWIRVLPLSRFGQVK
ncbi:MAG: signal peptidase I [Oscillospiraceae bacterium]|nr:signal peptidase I [Oscillospiraceae bacterium]MDD4367558.1 signal peptidase I [Oscillospiraceae bacterium]